MMTSRPQSRRCVRRPVAIAAAAALLGLGACTGGDDSSSAPHGLSGVGAFDTNRKAPAAPVDGAVPGGTVTGWGVAFDVAELSTMDPTEAYGPDSISILSGLVTRSLTQYVYDPNQKTMVLVPDIATDLGRPNEDFTQWDYTIRDGVKFEDGTEVTAADVAYGIKRSFDHQTFKQGPRYSSQFFLDGHTYKGPYTSGTVYSGIVVNGNTLTLKMARPFPDMPYYGAFPAIGPIPELGSDPDRYGQHPLATGPYKIAEFSPGKSLTLVRNDQWDPATDPGRHAYPDRYEFDFTQPFERIDPAILGDAGSGQTTVSLSGVSTEDLKTAQDRGRLIVGAAPCTFIWYPDYRKIPDIRVREAIGYAAPYAALARAQSQITGITALTGTSVLPPNFPGRQDYRVLDAPSGVADPAKARALLKEAGYAPGEYELTFTYSKEEPTPLSLLVSSLEAAGFKATPYVLPTFKDATRVQYDPDAPVNLRRGGWCQDFPSGTSWIPNLLQSDNPNNWSQFSEPAVDAEIERILRLPFTQQPAAWGRLDKKIMTKYYPLVVNYYQRVPLLFGSGLGGVNADDTNFGRPTWKDMYVIQ